MFTVLLITAICIILFIRILVVFQVQIQFFMMGQDQGFKFNEIILLWKLAKEAEIEEPLKLYVSVPTLNMAISKVIMNAKEMEPNLLKARRILLPSFTTTGLKSILSMTAKKALTQQNILKKARDSESFSRAKVSSHLKF